MTDTPRRPPADFTPWSPEDDDVVDNNSERNRNGGTGRSGAPAPDAVPARPARRMAPRMAPRFEIAADAVVVGPAPTPAASRSAPSPTPGPAPARERNTHPDRGQSGEDAPAAFIDSSAIVALVDQDDASHRDAVAAYHGLVGAGYRLFTTNYVVTETYELLRTGVGHAVARQWLRDSHLAVYHADEQDERRARRMVLQGRGSRGMTITDAVSLVVMERFGVADAFAVDPNFLSGGE